MSTSHTLRPRIAISGAQGTDGLDTQSVRAMAELITRHGGDAIVLDHARTPPDIGGFDALILLGNDYDIDPKDYHAEPSPHTKSEIAADTARDNRALTIAFARREYEYKALKQAQQQRMPVLGICGGMQRMNVAFGGTLNQHVEGHDQRSRDTPLDNDIAGSNLTIRAMTHLRALSEGHGHLKLPMARPQWFTQKQIPANSIHHQTVAQLAPLFRVAAVAEGGGAPVIKAIESKNRSFWHAIGIQWHPEFLPDHAFTKALVEDLIEAARRHRKQQSHGHVGQLEQQKLKERSLDAASL